MSSKELSASNIRKFATPFLAVLSTSMLLSSPLLAGAEEAADVAPAKVELGPAPTDFGLVQNDYYADCQKVEFISFYDYIIKLMNNYICIMQVVNHMRYVVQLEKGNPILSDLAQKTKDEMTDFVSFYRRFQGISGNKLLYIHNMYS